MPLFPIVTRNEARGCQSLAHWPEFQVEIKFFNGRSTNLHVLQQSANCVEQSQRRNVSAGLRWKRRWTNELRSADAASNVITFLKTRRRCWQKSRTVFTTGNMFAGGMLAVSTFFLLLLTPISITSPLTSPLHLTAFSTAGCQSLHNMGRPSSSERNQKLSFRLPCFATPQRAVIPLRTLTALRDAGRGQRR
eukprot:3387053-Rhodomonas_salina.1